MGFSTGRGCDSTMSTASFAFNNDSNGYLNMSFDFIFFHNFKLPTP